MAAASGANYQAGIAVQAAFRGDLLNQYDRYEHTENQGVNCDMKPKVDKTMDGCTKDAGQRAETRGAIRAARQSQTSPTAPDQIHGKPQHEGGGDQAATGH